MVYQEIHGARVQVGFIKRYTQQDSGWVYLEIDSKSFWLGIYYSNEFNQNLAPESGFSLFL